MPQFKVVLSDSVQLQDEQVHRLTHSIQRAVLAELAQIDARGDIVSAFIPKFGGETRGLIHAFTELERLPELQEELGRLNKEFG